MSYYISSTLSRPSDINYTHVMIIEQSFLLHIKEKRKTVEARLADTAMERVFPGDIIRFGCTGVQSGRHRSVHWTPSHVHVRAADLPCRGRVGTKTRARGEI